MAPTKEKGGPSKPVTNDPRFAKVHNDPRFRIPKQRLQKVKIDERFRERLQNDEDFKKRPTVDKYGRKKNVESAEKELSKYYNLKEGDDSEEESSEEESSDSEDEQEDKAEKKVLKPKTDQEDSDEEEALEAAEKLKKFRRARGEAVEDSESSSDEDSSDESEEEDLFIEENEVPLGDETTTFAAVNMDWDNIRAVDLMATFSSFVPPNGRIEWVRIYPSEYGKEKMNQEAVSGPPRDLFKGKKKSEDSDSEDEENKPLFEVDDGEDVESNSLRKYQLQRLRYYYAVVKCNSIGTARSIYDNCDGAEYEATANIFDLRYIPEGETFEDKPRDECTLVPANYQPPNYSTDALRHSKVRLTWDETPAERMQFAAKAFSRKEIEEMDVKAYLASDSEEEEEDDKEQKKNLYKSLLGQSDYSAVFNGDEKDDVDMEITFTPGLDEKKKKVEDEGEEDETTIEKYKRKMKERRKKHQDKVKEEKEAEKEEKIKNKKKKGKKGKEEEKESEETSKETAELELLMTEDGGEKRLDHFNMKEIMKAEKQLKKKGKKGKKGAEEAAPAGLDFKLDVNDERFQALYEDHDFAIDPTKPQFKKTQNMDRLMDERRKRAAENAEEDEAEPGPKKKKKGKSAFDAEKKQKKHKLEAGDQSLSALVDKVKRRARTAK